jgi:hypothetical protein
MNKKKYVLTTLCVLAVLMSHGQIQWKKMLGGTGNDYSTAIRQTRDGGYIFGGYSTSNDGDVSGNHGGYDCWIVKLNDTGGMDWQKSLGGSAGDYAYSIEQTYDGGYIVSGSSASTDGDVTGNHGSSDAWLIKLSSSGSVQWQRSIGGSSQDKATSITQTSDSGYIALGVAYSSDSDFVCDTTSAVFWIEKLSPAGGTEWQRCIPAASPSYSSANIRQVDDNGFIFAVSDVGVDLSRNHFQLYKLYPDGSEQWHDDLYTNLSYMHYPAEIGQVDDGGYVFVGTGTFSRWGVGVICKILSSGTIAWTRALPVYPSSFQQTTDGGYITAGNIDIDPTSLTNYDCGIFKLSADTAIQWKLILSGSSDDVATSVRQTADAGYIVIGNTKSNDGDFTANHGGSDIWVIKLGPKTGTGIETMANGAQLSITPNPTNGHIQIRGVNTTNIKIYNAFGGVIKEANNTDNISIAEFPAGMYLIRLSDINGLPILQSRVIKYP